MRPITGATISAKPTPVVPCTNPAATIADASSANVPALNAGVSAPRALPRAAHSGVDAPRPGPGDEQVQENEAEQHREIAAVQQWQPALREMRHEVRDRHVPRED